MNGNGQERVSSLYYFDNNLDETTFLGTVGNTDNLSPDAKILAVGWVLSQLEQLKRQNSSLCCIANDKSVVHFGDAVDFASLLLDNVMLSGRI